MAVTGGFQEPRSPVGDRERRQATAGLARAWGEDRTHDGASGKGTRAPSATAGAASSGYYGRPVIKEPVWTWEIPLYFLTGGIAGASSGLAFAASLASNERLAQRAQLAALGSIGVSPVLLISDLGKPLRFLNMLRMLKPSSPMSVGSWLLAANGAAISAATAGTLARRLPTATRAARGVAAALGLPLTTYTAVLIADTAVPLWHAGRYELPFAFGGSSAAGAGALAVLITPPAHAAQARRMAILGTAIEAVSMQVMERRLGRLARPLRRGPAGALAWAAKGLSTAGTGLLAYAGERRRNEARVGAAMVLAGEAFLRFAIFRAGFRSARDPAYTIEPQRQRIAEGKTDGMARG